MAATVIGTSGSARGHRRQPLGRGDQPHQVQPLGPRRAERPQRRDARAAGRDHHLQQHHLVGREIVRQARQVGVRLEGRLVAGQAHEAHPRARRAAGRAPAPAARARPGAPAPGSARRAGRVTRGRRDRRGHLPVHGLEVAQGLGHGEGAEHAGRAPHRRVGRPRVADRRQVRARRWRRTGRWSGGRAPGQPTRGAPEDDGRPRRTLGGAARRATSEPPRGMAPRRGARRERRHPLHRGPRRGRCGLRRVAVGDPHGRVRRARRRRALDGGRRVRLGELAARRRARRPAPRAPGARGGPRGRAGRAGRDLRGPRPERRARPPGGRGAVRG